MVVICYYHINVDSHVKRYLKWTQDGACCIHEEQSKITENISKSKESFSHKCRMESIPILPLSKIMELEFLNKTYHSFRYNWWIVQQYLSWNIFHYLIGYYTTTQQSACWNTYVWNIICVYTYTDYCNPSVYY